MEVESDGIVGHIDFAGEEIDYECKLTWGKEPPSTDKLFADNCEIQIKSPEECFPFEKKQYSEFIPSKTQELVLMMGFPGSGKTTYVKNCIPDTYTTLHGDILKTDAKKKKALKVKLDLT